MINTFVGKVVSNPSDVEDRLCCETALGNISKQSEKLALAFTASCVVDGEQDAIYLFNEELNMVLEDVAPESRIRDMESITPDTIKGIRLLSTHHKHCITEIYDAVIGVTRSSHRFPQWKENFLL